jgi:lipoprotein-anchoring transpeptidase ErfK/SrfK
MHRKSSWRLLSVFVLIVVLLVTALPAAAAPLDQGGGIHVVRRGETLSQIAQRYGLSMNALARANGIGNPNRIFVGQRLVLPGVGNSTAGSSGGGNATSSGTLHVVRAGENLSTIAARYGTTTAALAAANGISNPNHIYAGQRLTIASGAAAPRQAVQRTRSPAASSPAASAGGRWIDIDLSGQTLTAYDGNTPVFQRLVSTGLAFPTPVGTYQILYKVQSQRMTGPGYDLPNVPWVMYFTNRGHAIHGAYWHNNFGHPMSHGCVNMRIEDARWLYNWAPNGTPVVVHR